MRESPLIALPGEGERRLHSGLMLDELIGGAAYFKPCTCSGPERPSPSRHTLIAKTGSGILGHAYEEGAAGPGVPTAAVDRAYERKLSHPARCRLPGARALSLRSLRARKTLRLRVHDERDDKTVKPKDLGENCG